MIATLHCWIPRTKNASFMHVVAHNISIAVVFSKHCVYKLLFDVISLHRKQRKKNYNNNYKLWNCFNLLKQWRLSICYSLRASNFRYANNQKKNNNKMTVDFFSLCNRIGYVSFSTLVVFSITSIAIAIVFVTSMWIFIFPNSRYHDFINSFTFFFIKIRFQFLMMSDLVWSDDFTFILRRTAFTKNPGRRAIYRMRIYAKKMAILFQNGTKRMSILFIYKIISIF